MNECYFHHSNCCSRGRPYDMFASHLLPPFNFVGIACTMPSLHPPPLLTWKGMQSWAVGSRAPSLCKLFVKTKTPAKIRVARFLKWRREGRVPVLIQWDGSGKKQSTTSSTLGICLPSCVRASSCKTDRGSARLISAYERVKIRYGIGTTPRVLKLGSYPTQVESPLQRQGSSISTESQSASISVNSSKMNDSPSVLSSKLKGTCTRIMTAAQHNSPQINDLFVGNQFLTHVTAAPIAGGANAELLPSSGLINASRRQRDSQIRDRILFFK